MKNLRSVPLLALTLFLTGSCNRISNSLSDLISSVSAQRIGTTLLGEKNYSRSIPIDTANRMIKSYLNGIDYRVNTGETRSWIFNADTLRTFLKEGKIVRLKLMLAHTQEYMQSGGEGKRPSQNTHALTLVISGIDADNNYVYNVAGEVYNRCQPCPTECIGQGTASLDTLVVR